MKQLGKKIVISLVALVTFGAVSSKQAEQNTTYAQSVNATQLRTSANLLKAVNNVHETKDPETVKKEMIEKAKAAAKAKAAKAEAAKEAVEAAKAKEAALLKSYKKSYRRNGTTLYKYVAPEKSGNVENTKTYKAVQKASGYTGGRLTRSAGVYSGPNGKETYYNLNMSRVVANMKAAGYKGNYWVRSDGVKMFGNYVIAASNLSVRPRGSVFQTSLGLALVCDTGSFASSNPRMTDIATAW